MRERGYDINQLLRHMEYDRSTLIWAPRPSGKTTALVEKFKRTPNSIYVVSKNHNKKHIERGIMYSSTYPNYKLDGIYSIEQIHCQNHRSRRVDTVFIDEIASFEDRQLEIVRRDLSHIRIVATSTPSGSISGIFYDIFHNQIRVANEDGKFEVITGDILSPDHFKDQGDLFTI